METAGFILNYLNLAEQTNFHFNLQKEMCSSDLFDFCPHFTS